MIEYDKDIQKAIEKRKIPDKVFSQIHNCFLAIEKIGDLSIFDIKKIKGDYEYDYFRLRKGNYRAIFHMENKNIHVVALEHRSEVYKKWES
jgi:mRNA-degrading endonuclease RelE of RelBE toxin-antitoxin system